MSSRVIPLGDWELAGHWLRPTRHHLEKFMASYSAGCEKSPLITFKLPQPIHDPTTPLSVHKSRLLSVEGPLAVLANGPFSESAPNEVKFEESLESFQIIRNFLYLHTIDMRKVPPKFVMVADRWGLSLLFDACLRWAESTIFDPGAREYANVKDFFLTYIPVIAAVDVPNRFKSHFALRVAIALNDPEDEAISSILYPLVYQGLAENRERRARKKRRIETVLHVETPLRTDNATAASAGESSAVQDTAEGDTERNSSDEGSEFEIDADSDEEEELVSVDVGMEDIWEVFRVRGMIDHMVHYLAMYSEPRYLVDLLDVVLRVLEPRLSDEDFARAIRLIPWYHEECGDILKSTTSDRWSSRAWHLLAIELMRSQSRQGRSVTLTMRCEGRCLWDDTTFVRSVHDADYFGNKVQANIRRDSTSGGLSLYLTITHPNLAIRNSCSSMKAVIVQDGCGCGLDTARPELATRFIEGKRLRTGPLPQSMHACYTLMSREAVDEWKQTHSKECALLIRMVLWL